ncbi:protein ECERIFERUM 1 [Tripterygium wilfordii]|uniref:Protein ECERIFERUM 1 n=1 Tax=Tripterygium wilfordii TaxID=458696 RepID=A0A7J7DK75_TRIWF|nr:protein ECERIFERUM 2-like [Tripterygium wilfordii]KAF5746765.1 protein ECERIFERUM 1 [Tripterygium wilfordii]
MVMNSSNDPVRIQTQIIHGTRISSVVPGRATGENKVHELTPLDLAMKLHYIRGLYFFRAEAVQGLSVHDLKGAMFPWLELYYPVSGRIRQGPDSGRPFIRCNDGGVRVVEAWCDDFSVDEWLAMEGCGGNDDGLVYNQALGPDLGFSPLVYVQFTWFKCGGMSLGLSWAHVLGDPFSVSAFINKWAQIMAGTARSQPLHVSSIQNYKSAPTIPKSPLSIKRVDPVGDCWVTASNCQMESHSFLITSEKLDQLMKEILNPSQATKISEFEALSALIWKSLSEIRDDLGPRIVTICTNSPQREENEPPSNAMEFSIVEPDFSVSKADVSDLAVLITEKRVGEDEAIRDLVQGDNGEGDYLVYGTNLTFVNLEEVNVYGLELKGQKPVFANYRIGGVGDEGVVVVCPGPESGVEGGRGGRLVTVMLPEDQVVELKNVLQRDWDLV